MWLLPIQKNEAIIYKTYNINSLSYTLLPLIITKSGNLDVYDKLPVNDQDVIINSDCWIGANVTILKGVEIGRGCVIAACSCVKNLPPHIPL